MNEEKKVRLFDYWKRKIVKLRLKPVIYDDDT